MYQKIGVVGLGYVGLPLALAFGKYYETIGYDISEEKIEAYKNKQDPAGEIELYIFDRARNFEATTDESKLSDCDFIIIAIPTPVDKNNKPDFTCLENASQLVGEVMRKGCTIVYESTVYPGATESICIPILETASGLTWKDDFSVGYSPERVSPGKGSKSVTEILKIVSGDTPETASKLEHLYKSIIDAGVYVAPSIKVAEAAKIIENIQRDVNIALMNELAMIFNKLGINTNEVIDAASTKWNFAPYRPGLVGGHCIGVDPYYLIDEALSIGFNPELLIKAREINEQVPSFIVSESLKSFDHPEKLKVAIFGLTFKENCQDLRNSKVVELYNLYKESCEEVFIYDPVAARDHVLKEYGVNQTEPEALPEVDLIVLAVPHDELMKIETLFKQKLKLTGKFVDVKGAFRASKEKTLSKAFTL